MSKRVVDWTSPDVMVWLTKNMNKVSFNKLILVINEIALCVNVCSLNHKADNLQLDHVMNAADGEIIFKYIIKSLFSKPA